MPSLPRKSPVQSDRVAYFSTVVPGLDFNRRQQCSLDLPKGPKFTGNVGLIASSDQAADADVGAQPRPT